MAVTDQQVLNDIQRLLIETVNNGLSYSSGLWSAAEVIGYSNQRQDQFLKETGILLKETSIGVANALRMDLPTDWINTKRVIAQPDGDPDAAYRELFRIDQYQADNVFPTWQTTNADEILAYNDTDIPQLQIELIPKVDYVPYNRDIIILYNYIGTTLSNSGIAYTVPDDFTPYIKWGILADMLNKIGRGQDLQRAQYCELRYQEGITAAKIMQEGWA